MNLTRLNVVRTVVAHVRISQSPTTIVLFLFRSSVYVTDPMKKKLRSEIQLLSAVCMKSVTQHTTYYIMSLQRTIASRLLVLVTFCALICCSCLIRWLLFINNVGLCVLSEQKCALLCAVYVAADIFPAEKSENSSTQARFFLLRQEWGGGRGGGIFFNNNYLNSRQHFFIFCAYKCSSVQAYCRFCPI